MKTLLLLASAALLGLVAPANATQIVVFGQTSAAGTVHATTNGADTQTTLTVTNAAVQISQLFGGAPGPADFDLSATSIDAAQAVGGAVIQHYSGSFKLFLGPLDILSGTFTDAAFGAGGGPGLTVNVNDPPDTLALTSAVIPAKDLLPPGALSLAFTDLSPALAILGQTIAPFTAAFAGDVSATPAVEPGALAVLGVGLLGLCVVRVRRRSVPPAAA